MYPARYFAPRFFAPRYWPKVGAVLIVQFGSLTGQAVDRLRARVAARLRGQNVDRTR